MDFAIIARGYTRSDNTRILPDGEEHTITLPTALTVHGSVSDATTGQPIPHFSHHPAGRNQILLPTLPASHWSTMARFWLDFAQGTYRHTFEEPMVMGEANPGYVMKFEAEGYASFISRTLAPDEGDVQIDVTLKPVAVTTVTVHNPDGQLAVNADVGLVSPGARLSLIQGGFDRKHLQSGGSLLKTEADGTFKLPADESVQRVIAASADGYAGRCCPLPWLPTPFSNCNRGVGCKSPAFRGASRTRAGNSSLIWAEGRQRQCRLGFEMAHVVSDAQGQISVAQLPPGQHHLNQIHSVPMGPGGRAFMQGNRTPFQIRPDEITSLTIDTNYTIAARLQWPSGMSRSTDWHISAALTPAHACGDRGKRIHRHTRNRFRQPSILTIP